MYYKASHVLFTQYNIMAKYTLHNKHTQYTWNLMCVATYISNFVLFTFHHPNVCFPYHIHKYRHWKNLLKLSIQFFFYASYYIFFLCVILECSSKFLLPILYLNSFHFHLTIKRMMVFDIKKIISLYSSFQWIYSNSDYKYSIHAVCIEKGNVE